MDPPATVVPDGGVGSVVLGALFVFLPCTMSLHCLPLEILDLARVASERVPVEAVHVCLDALALEEDVVLLFSLTWKGKINKSDSICLFLRENENLNDKIFHQSNHDMGQSRGQQKTSTTSFSNRRHHRQQVVERHICAN